jgi:hypothetical protein
MIAMKFNRTEGPRVERLVVLPDPSRGERFERIRNDRAKALGSQPPLVLTELFVVGDGEDRDRRRLRRVSRRRAPALVVQVEPDLRFEAIAECLEHAPLGRREPQGVAVDVDPLRVATLPSRGAVRVEHRDQVDGQLLQHAPDGLIRTVPRDVLDDIEERRRGRRLVPVHLGPQQDVKRPVPDPQVVDRPSFDRLADLFEREQVGRPVPRRSQPSHDLLVDDELREGR